MNDIYAWLLSAPPNALWLLDDNADFGLIECLPAACTVLSNRFELARAAAARGIRSHFSDWSLPNRSRFPAVVMRVGKEKRVQEHLLRCATTWLEPDGELWLAGGKQEGVKSIAARAQALGYAGALRKYGNLYGGHFRPAGDVDADDYFELRRIGQVGAHALLSKPGVYGWEKIDRGSELLIEFAQSRCSPGSRLLDLGAGYGYLTLAAAGWPAATRAATDNNAAALICLRANAELAGLDLRVEAGDCGDTLPASSFDLVLCNPPFHSGFTSDFGLTERFAAGAARLLAANGRALFVVNRFVPLPARAAPWFAEIAPVATDGAYSVFELRRPRPTGPVRSAPRNAL